jgi:hypothetical protein
MKKLTQIGKSMNAYTFAFDGNLLSEIRGIYESVIASGFESNPELRPMLFRGEGVISANVNILDYSFSIRSYSISPLLWVSNNDMRTYDVFRKFFGSLAITEDVKELVNYKKDIVLYSGFFVISDHLDREIWHVDYHKGANAYTLITPLYDLHKDHGNLLYKDKDSNIHKYTYKLNEAIIFGDEFHHTTESYGPAGEVRVLLSLTFGTDMLDYWSILKETIGTQSEFFILPCGHQAGTCNCL